MPSCVTYKHTSCTGYLSTYLPTCLPSYLKTLLSIYISTTPYPCPFLFKCENKNKPLGKTKGTAPMGKLMGNAKPLQQSLVCKCFPWQKRLTSFLTIVAPRANCLEGLHPYIPSQNENLVGALLANNFALFLRTKQLAPLISLYLFCSR